MGSFPTSNIKQPQIFTMQLLDDVMEREPSYAVLESTCRELRRTQKFMPSIAEFVAELDKQEEEWGARGGAHWWALNTYNKLVAGIPAAEAQLTAEQAEREKQRQAAEEKKRADDELRAQPLAFGARVRYRTQPFKMYTIISEHDAWRGGNNFLAWSDETNDTVLVGGPELQRAIPDDYNFETPAEVRAKFATNPRVLRKRRPVVGDRVTDDIREWWTDPEFPPHGAGTVVFAGDFGPDGYRDCFDIQFDNGTIGTNYMTYQLNRLLPDDPEFERSEKVVAGWREWELKQVDVEAGGKSGATTAGACQQYSVPDERAE
jgi:hypothetical protein